jgi:methylenetetrahydrofolate reductase (NADPH)
MTHTLEQIKETISNPPPVVSFEFFPPKGPEGLASLKETIQTLATFAPDYVSVTYGAGGTTKNQTQEVVDFINEQTSLTAAAHLTCVDALKEETNAIAKNYLDKGVSHIVALRGDMPGMEGNYKPLDGGYAYADDLVAGLKSIGDFTVHVAAYPETHPQALSKQADIDHLKRKQDAGADFAITQYCFDTDTLLRFVEDARKNGINMPIIPGIMPIANFKQVANFSARCGASIPEWLRKAFEHYDQYPASKERETHMAVHIATEQCRLLTQEGLNHFHFYTLNQAPIVATICDLLGVGQQSK